MKRREVIKKLSLTPLAGGLLAVSPIESLNAAPFFAKRDVFSELGLRTFINAAGNYTSMTASLTHADVMEAIQSASKEFVMLEEVQDKVGQKIAALCKAEAAMVTAG